jgi:hypothetical protein
MTPTRDLAGLQYCASRALARLRRDGIAVTVGPTLQVAHRPVVARLSVELLNAWTNFVRAYYLSSALFPRGSKGKRITAVTKGMTEIDTIGYAIVLLRSNVPPPPPPGKPWDRRKEPTWHVPDTIVKLADKLKFSNYSHVGASMSLGFRVFDDLPSFRNYFAHRNAHTQGIAQRLAPRYGVSPVLRPWDILASRATGRPQAIIVDWIDDVDQTVEFLCE